MNRHEKGEFSQRWMGDNGEWHEEMYSGIEFWDDKEWMPVMLKNSSDNWCIVGKEIPIKLKNSYNLNSVGDDFYLIYNSERDELMSVHTSRLEILDNG